jgi:hypothetical protein
MIATRLKPLLALVGFLCLLFVGKTGAQTAELTTSLPSSEPSSQPVPRPVPRPTLQPTVGLRLELPTDQLSVWLDAAMAEPLSGTGQKRVCQRLLGIKVCGDASWQYDVTRIGPSKLLAPSSDNPNVRMDVPLDVAALVGVSGDAAKVLGLSSVPVKARLNLAIAAEVSDGADGCPQVALSITPNWISDPTAVLFGKVTFSLSSVIEDVLARQIQPLQDRLNHMANCDALLQVVQPLLAPCYVDVSDERVGPTLVKVDWQQLHWALPRSQDNTMLSVALGLSLSAELQVGLTAEEMSSSLSTGSCKAAVEQLVIRSDPDNLQSGEILPVVFHSEPFSITTQPVTVVATFDALSRYTQKHYDDDVAKNSLEQTPVLLTKWVVDGIEDNSTGTNELAVSAPDNPSSFLQVGADFQAQLPADQGFLARVLRLFTPKDTVLDGHVTVQATPAWNADKRQLSLVDVTTKVTSFHSESTPMMQQVAYELLERSVQKRINEASPWEVAGSLDNLNDAINRSLDNAIASRAVPWVEEGVAGWTPGTAQLRIETLKTSQRGMELDAQLQAQWRLRFSTRAWPTVSWQNIR